MKLTPLNLLTSAFLVFGVLLLVSPKQQVPVLSGLNGLVTALCFVAAVIAFVTDLIFRKFIPSLRNIWITETSFIVFTLVLVVILKMTIS